MNIVVDDKYHRQKLITWWDQDKLTNSNVLVVGAGALGNEIVKNLALVGVGKIHIVDMDKIENSNLSRGVFFRNSDLGSFKAEVVTSRVMELNPDISVTFDTVEIQKLGVGFINNFDLIIGGLDNREARLWINRAARKLGKYWVDGAIEGIRGLVRMFGVDGPCYECTLGEKDWQILNHRKSCALLRPDDILSGKVPTNATTASVIGALQVQEAIKFLVGSQESLSLEGRSLNFVGENMSFFINSYEEDPDCLSHDLYQDIYPWNTNLDSKTLKEIGNAYFPNIKNLQFDFEDDFVVSGKCINCTSSVDFSFFSHFASPGVGHCTKCDEPLALNSMTSCGDTDELANRKIKEMNFAFEDILTIRNGMARVHQIIKRG
jgi:molybdopterin/thiamine biosynthesis adenylyltransferase